MPRTLVAIPARNEAATIGAAIDDVRHAEDLAPLTARMQAAQRRRPGTEGPSEVRSDNGLA